VGETNAIEILRVHFWVSPLGAAFSALGSRVGEMKRDRNLASPFLGLSALRFTPP